MAPPRNRLAVAFGRLADRLEGDDFPRFAERNLKITAKDGTLIPLRLNRAQRAIHGAVERQLAETGKVRALVVKARQQGASTYIQGRMFWHVSRGRGLRGYIVTHADEATKRLFEMAKRFYDHCPAPVRPSLRASNARELLFDQLDSGYAVSTAGAAEPGRASTFQLLHGSECAFWPRDADLVAGALQAVPDAPATEIVLESTSAGPRGLFFEMCQVAMRGESDFQLIFTPWHVQDEYRRRPPAGFVLSGEEDEYSREHSLDLAQMCWRRAKILELHGIWNFRREYPATVEEAFAAETPGALWRRDVIEATRVYVAPPLRRIVIGVDPSGGGQDEAGIVAAGIAYDGHVYVVGDSSGKMSPKAWASRTVAAYQRHQADKIVAESNFGGQMVADTIRTVDPNAPVKLVTASRGKQVRAEPVAALYETGRVHHVGSYPALEDELVTWDPASSTRSPGRLDALVWAISELTGGADFSAWDEFIKRDREQFEARAQGLPVLDVKPAAVPWLVPAARDKPSMMITQTNTGDTSNAVTMRAPQPWSNFYVSAHDGRGRRFSADGDGLIPDVPRIFIEGLKAHGCVVFEGAERAHLKRRAQQPGISG